MTKPKGDEELFRAAQREQGKRIGHIEERLEHIDDRLGLLRNGMGEEFHGVREDIENLRLEVHALSVLIAKANGATKKS